MLRIDCFMFLITGFYDFQQTTHERPQKIFNVIQTICLLLEVLDVPESDVLAPLITDSTKYMALGLPGKLSVTKENIRLFFLKALPDKMSDVSLK